MCFCLILMRKPWCRYYLCFIDEKCPEDESLAETQSYLIVRGVSIATAGTEAQVYLFSHSFSFLSIFVTCHLSHRNYQKEEGGWSGRSSALDQSQNECHPWVMESSSYQVCVWASRRRGTDVIGGHPCWPGARCLRHRCHRGASMVTWCPLP